MKLFALTLARLTPGLLVRLDLALELSCIRSAELIHLTSILVKLEGRHAADAASRRRFLRDVKIQLDTYAMRDS